MRGMTHKLHNRECTVNGGNPSKSFLLWVTFVWHLFSTRFPAANLRAIKWPLLGQNRAAHWTLLVCRIQQGMRSCIFNKTTNVCCSLLRISPRLALQFLRSPSQTRRVGINRIHAAASRVVLGRWEFLEHGFVLNPHHTPVGSGVLPRSCRQMDLWRPAWGKRSFSSPEFFITLVNFTWPVRSTRKSSENSKVEFICLY